MQVTLRLGRREFADDATLVMAIVDAALVGSDASAFERVAQAVTDGAEIVDLAGPAGDAAELVSLVGRVRAAYPDRVIGVGTSDAEVARAVCREGADLLWEPAGGEEWLDEVAAEWRTGLVCRPAPGDRARSADAAGAAIEAAVARAERAVAAGVRRESVLVDPGLDVADEGGYGLEVTARLGELVATGWPVLVAPAELATTSLCALAGARVFRVHDVVETRQAVDMVNTIAGRRLPQRAIRGLQ